MASPFDELLSLPAIELLGLFGAGQATPGSGSAAAFVGLMSASMLITGCELTMKKPKYRRRHDRFRRIVEEARVVEARLTPLVQADHDAFGKVYEARVARDKADSVQPRLEKRLLVLEESATDIALTIAEGCVELLELACEVTEDGYWSAAAEATGAAHMARAGASTAMAAAGLNLWKHGANKMATQRRRRARLAARLEDVTDQFCDGSAAKRLSPTRQQRHRQMELEKRLGPFADRLPANARRNLQNMTHRVVCHLAELLDDEVEAVVSELQTRAENEQQFLHNQLTDKQIESLIKDVVERRSRDA